ncbi:sodium:solute symporter family transporter [Povalibacter sp.]|uniref:sodium:solute symporter family transporter n=1 Tax=Povalibacter sp. TaxID=1962978 RepID=UPI002F409EBA
MTRATAALIVLCAYAAALIAMAIWGGRRTHNGNDFFLASRRLSTWLVAFSHVANASPAWLLLALSGAAFVWGLAAVWIWLAVVVGYALNAFYVGPRLRQLSIGQGSLTVVQVLSTDAGDRLQPLIVRSAALILSLALLLEISAVLHAAGSAFAIGFGFDFTSACITAIAAIAIVTLVGGFWSLSFSDIVQVGVLFVVGCIVPMAAIAVSGGVEQLQIGFQALGPEMTDWFAGRKGVVALALVVGISGLGFELTGQPHALARYMAARDESTLRNSRWIALACIAILLALMLVCGWSASVLYAGLERPEQAIPVVLERILSPLVSGFLVALLLGVMVIGMGNRLLILASCLSVDMKRSVSPLSFAWARVVLVFYAVIALCLALYATDSLLNQAMFAFAAVGASFGPLLLVRLTGKRVRPGSTLGAMWAGFVLTVLFHVLPDAPGDFLERVLPFVASLGIALTGGERRHNPDRADRSQETVHDRVAI